MYVVQRDRLQLSHFFLQQSFIILLSLLSPIPCNPYKQGVREVMAIHYFMQEKCLQPPLYPPCLLHKPALSGGQSRLVQ